MRYDLAGVKKALTKDALKQRPADLWRYREMLPVRKVRHRQPRRSNDAADPAAEDRKESAAARSSSRMRAACRPDRSRRAAW